MDQYEAALLVLDAEHELFCQEIVEAEYREALQTISAYIAIAVAANPRPITNMSSGRHWEQDKEATIYVGNLDERTTDKLIWEVMIQCGRVVNVHLPRDRVTQAHQGYGFVEFQTEEDATYVTNVLNGIKLFAKPMRINKASADKQKTVEIGAELFVGNLDPMVDEKTLFDTFSRFGSLVAAPKIARDDANLSKGYGFVSFSNFEASDEAIANMHGQYLMNKEATVQYAYKKDGKGERHGDQAERMLAAQARKHNVQPTAQPFTPMFAAAPSAPAAMANGGGMGGPPSRGGPGYGFSGPGFDGPPHHAAPTPLPPPPSGLPARPPPSQAGYGGPQGFMPPGFPPPPQGF
ncbi:hypothetical protein LTR04_001891, partial [Oleoguttula sp. CCFEE 6159]